MIRPVVNIQQRTRDQFVQQTTRAAARAAERELVEIGEAWVAEVTKIVQEELPRRDGRRHKTNTTHLDQSFQYRIRTGPDGGFPMRLELTVKPGVNSKKIAALEFGNPGTYTITARNAEHLRWGSAPGDLHKPFQKSVEWKPDGPNSKGKIAGGYAFMRRARDRVLARRRGR